MKDAYALAHIACFAFAVWIGLCAGLGAFAVTFFVTAALVQGIFRLFGYIHKE